MLNTNRSGEVIHDRASSEKESGMNMLLNRAAFAVTASSAFEPAANCLQCLRCIASATLPLSQNRLGAANTCRRIRVDKGALVAVGWFSRRWRLRRCHDSVMDLDPRFPAGAPVGAQGSVRYEKNRRAQWNVWMIVNTAVLMQNLWWFKLAKCINTMEFVCNKKIPGL